MKLTKKILKITYLILLLIVMVIFYYNFTTSIGDVIWNYGFAHAIRIGEIPYKDFNMVLTPLFSFITSIGLFIYDDLSMFLLEGIILNIVLLYILYKLFNKNLFYILPIYIIFFLLKTFIPTYNLLVLILLFLLILFERQNKNDLSIGIILGLLIISKHSIGFVISFISLLLVIKNKKKVGKRLLGLIIPCIIFLIYLILTKSLYNCIDLCILGLFDFAGNNTYIVKRYLLMVIITFIINILLLIKYRKKNPKELVYYLGSLFLVIPIIDLYHTYLYIFTAIIIVLLVLIDNNKIKYKNQLNLMIISMNIILLIGTILIINNQNNIRLNINHFKYIYMSKDKVSYIRDIYNKYNEYDNSMMLGNLSTLIDISSDHNITHFNIMSYGNWGYNIDKKVMDKFNKIHNKYIFVKQMKDRRKGNQDYYYIYDYIEENYKKLDTIYDYDIYYKE